MSTYIPGVGENRVFGKQSQSNNRANRSGKAVPEYSWWSRICAAVGDRGIVLAYNVLFPKCLSQWLANLFFRASGSCAQHIQFAIPHFLGWLRRGEEDEDEDTGDIYLVSY